LQQFFQGETPEGAAGLTPGRNCAYNEAVWQRGSYSFRFATTSSAPSSGAAAAMLAACSLFLANAFSISVRNKLYGNRNR
jgi:hypothetical protein